MQELDSLHGTLVRSLLDKFDAVENVVIPIAAANVFARNGCISMYALSKEMERVLDITGKSRIEKLGDKLTELSQPHIDDEAAKCVKLLTA